MSWYAIDVQASPGARDEVAAWLVIRTGQAVEERADGTLVSFALDVSAADGLVKELGLRYGGDVAGAARAIPEVDWTLKWREGLGPRTVGRITIVPSWYEAALPEGQLLTIDPESAFGSGEHGSTRSALALLDRQLRPGALVLDFGSGSGILSIAAVLLGATRAVGIEQDAEAIAVAERNATINRVTGRVDFFEGDAGQLAALFQPADLVVSNILRVVNIALLPEVRRVLRSGGVAIFSGMEVSEAPEFRAPLTASGFTILEETIDAGWWAVAAASPA